MEIKKIITFKIAWNNYKLNLQTILFFLMAILCFLKGAKHTKI